MDRIPPSVIIDRYGLSAWIVELDVVAAHTTTKHSTRLPRTRISIWPRIFLVKGELPLSDTSVMLLGVTARIRGISAPGTIGGCSSGGGTEGNGDLRPGRGIDPNYASSSENPAGKVVAGLALDTY